MSKLFEHRSEEEQEIVEELIAALDGLIETISWREDAHGERFHNAIRHKCATGEGALKRAKGK